MGLTASAAAATGVCIRTHAEAVLLAAVHGEYAAPPKNGNLYTEEDWNETSSIDNGQAYHLSKASGPCKSTC